MIAIHTTCYGCGNVTLTTGDGFCAVCGQRKPLRSIPDPHIVHLSRGGPFIYAMTVLMAVLVIIYFLVRRWL